METDFSDPDACARVGCCRARVILSSAAKAAEFDINEKEMPQYKTIKSDRNTLAFIWGIRIIYYLLIGAERCYLTHHM